MKLSDAIRIGHSQPWQEIQLRHNPSKKTEWFVMLISAEYKSYVLVDDNEKPWVTESLDAVSALVKELNGSEFTAYL